MDHAGFHIEFANYPDDLDALRAVREPVFLVEQKVPEELEWDEMDPLSVHALALDSEQRPIGTARLTPEHTIGRMAVLSDWRQRGVGSALLRSLIERAKELRYPHIELHAQTHAIGFYERFGFVAFGPEYDEAGIPHRSMRLDLEAGHDERALRDISSQHELQELSRKVISQARREVAIYTRDLDPVLLGNRETLDVLRTFAIGTRHAHVRVLTHDLNRALQDGHGLISLSQRLPSRFSIRVIEQEPDVQYAGAFILGDRPGYVFRSNATRPEASASLHDPARHRQLMGYFDEVWERARPASELRALS